MALTLEPFTRNVPAKYGSMNNFIIKAKHKNIFATSGRLESASKFGTKLSGVYTISAFSTVVR